MTGGGVVAVDVGNSTVTLAIQSDGQLLPHVVSLQHANWTTRCLEWAHEQFGCDELRWLIASVRSSAASELIERLSTQPDEVVTVTRVDVPLEVTVDAPDQVGIDRLLAAHAAKQILPTPLAIVDAGSAITVDWIDQRGRFCGGAILPGLSMQAEALHRWTEALPNVSSSMEEPSRLPGKNTVDAIRGGIVAGAAGAIDALVARYGHPAAESCSIALTGGHGTLIAPLLRQNHRLLPNLVCRGLLELPRSKQTHRPESEIH